MTVCITKPDFELSDKEAFGEVSDAIMAAINQRSVAGHSAQHAAMAPSEENPEGCPSAAAKPVLYANSEKKSFDVREVIINGLLKPGMHAPAPTFARLV